jgi:hypothetical protein
MNQTDVLPMVALGFLSSVMRNPTYEAIAMARRWISTLAGLLG